MAPSAVNDAGRADEGILARWNKDLDGSLVSTGSANAYVVAANQTLSAYYDGLTLTFDANFTNTGAATLNVDAVSADAIVWPDGTALTGNEIVSGAKVTVKHDGTNWQLGAGTTRRLPAVGAETATTSGTTSDIAIGAGARRITGFIRQVSTDGTGSLLIQLADSGGFETSGYTGAHSSPASWSSGAILSLMAAGESVIGAFQIDLQNASLHRWVLTSNMSRSDPIMSTSAGFKALSAGPLTQLRLTTSAADTFDFGSWNIRIEY